MFMMEVINPKNMKARLSSKAHPLLLARPYTTTKLNRLMPREKDEPIEAMPTNFVVGIQA